MPTDQRERPAFRSLSQGSPNDWLAVVALFRRFLQGSAPVRLSD
jgi:hypothetical protein